MTPGIAARLLITMMLWAACFPLIALVLDQSPHLVFAALRAALAGLFLCSIAMTMRRALPREGWVWFRIILIAFCTTSLGFLGMFHAAEFISPGTATVIANVQPLFAAFLGHIVLGERLTFLGKAGLLVGFLGVLSVSWAGLGGGQTSDYQIGLVYISLAVIGVAIGNIGFKSLVGLADPVLVIGLQFAIGAMPLAFLSFFFEDFSTISWSVQFVVVLLALAVLGTAVPYWLWLRAFANVTLNQANSFTYFVPVFGLVMGVLMFDERVGVYQFVGIMLIFLGTYLSQRTPCCTSKHQAAK